MNRPEHCEIIRNHLFEITEFVLGKDPALFHTVEATLGSALVLREFDEGLEEQAIACLPLRQGIPEHQSAGEIRIVRDRQHVAACPGVQTSFLEQLPQNWELVASSVVGRDRAVRDVLVPKDHVAMHVEGVRRVGVFVAYETREATFGGAVVGLLRRLLNSLPGIRLRLVAIRQGARERLRNFTRRNSA